jgi:hypothetical protein
LRSEHIVDCLATGRHFNQRSQTAVEPVLLGERITIAEVSQTDQPVRIDLRLTAEDIPFDVI